MKKVYIAIWEDRHSDTDAFVFSDKEKAIEWAKRTVREYNKHGDLDETLNERMKTSGWLYCGQYSCEGDNIYVKSCEIDSEK